MFGYIYCVQNSLNVLSQWLKAERLSFLLPDIYLFTSLNKIRSMIWTIQFWYDELTDYEASWHRKYVLRNFGIGTVTIKWKHSWHEFSKIHHFIPLILTGWSIKRTNSCNWNIPKEYCEVTSISSFSTVYRLYFSKVCRAWTVNFDVCATVKIIRPIMDYPYSG